MFKRNEQEYQCIAPGYIKITDLIEKYYPELSDHKKVNMHDNLRKKITKVPQHMKAKAGNARYVLEKEFCAYLEIGYQEDAE